jgi:hypothetical protein
MTEANVSDALMAARPGARRPTLLVRLHQRLCALRMAREREELLAEAAAAAAAAAAATAAAAPTPRS